MNFFEKWAALKLAHEQGQLEATDLDGILSDLKEATDRLALRERRPYSEAMDRLLGVRIDVLNDGFVRPVDYMGNDASVVQAARVSYGAGTKTPSDDRTLLRHLMREWHTSPSEMVELKLHVRVPMDTWRQWIRHRTANVNEYSTRYSEAIDSCQKTDPTAWRPQSKTNKQGSEEGRIQWPDDHPIDLAWESISRELPSDYVIAHHDEPGDYLTAREEVLHRLAREIYEERLRFGVAREQARKDLPLSTYTEAYWKIDAHNLLHFLRLRMDSHAQKEIRAYADAIATIVLAWLPLTWEAFVDYRMVVLSLSRMETQVVHHLTRARHHVGWEDVAAGAGMSKREIAEFASKLRRLGFFT